MTGQELEDIRGALQRVLDTHALVCGAVITAEGDVLMRVGDFDRLSCSGLASALLGPYGSAESTFSFLDGQMLPKVWCQGQDYAFLDKPCPDLAVIVFGTDGGGAVDQFRISKRVGSSISTEFARGSSSSLLPFDEPKQD